MAAAVGGKWWDFGCLYKLFFLGFIQNPLLQLFLFFFLFTDWSPWQACHWEPLFIHQVNSALDVYFVTYLMMWPNWVWPLRWFGFFNRKSPLVFVADDQTRLDLVAALMPSYILLGSKLLARAWRSRCSISTTTLSARSSCWKSWQLMGVKRSV